MADGSEQWQEPATRAADAEVEATCWAAIGGDSRWGADVPTPGIVGAARRTVAKDHVGTDIANGKNIPTENGVGY